MQKTVSELQCDCSCIPECFEAAGKRDSLPVPEATIPRGHDWGMARAENCPLVATWALLESASVLGRTSTFNLPHTPLSLFFFLKLIDNKEKQDTILQNKSVSLLVPLNSWVLKSMTYIFEALTLEPQCLSWKRPSLMHSFFLQILTEHHQVPGNGLSAEDIRVNKKGHGITLS